jgi:hypothetical protein
MRKKKPTGPRMVVTFIGLIAGGWIGFLNRPAAPLVGKLPFEKVFLAGTNLKGLEKLLVSTARTSFDYMLLGAVIGLLAGIITGSLLFKSKIRY